MVYSLDDALSGISGILVTPYNDKGDIAPKKLSPIIDRALDAGMHLPVVNGNTGEFYALTTNEAKTMVEEVVALVNGRAPLLAGIGRSIGDAIELTKASVKAGASGLMIHQPPDPFVSPRGTLDYVKAIADAADGLPIMLYLRNDNIGINTISELCALPTVKGVKWATPNPMKLAEAIRICEPSITWVGGLAEVWAPVFCAAGAKGFTSGLINIWPERSFAIHQALEAGDFTMANRLIKEMKAFEDIRAEENNGTNVTAVKAALIAQGFDCGATRPPSAWPLTQVQMKNLHAFLDMNKLT